MAVKDTDLESYIGCSNKVLLCDAVNRRNANFVFTVLCVSPDNQLGHESGNTEETSVNKINVIILSFGVK